MSILRSNTRTFVSRSLAAITLAIAGVSTSAQADVTFTESGDAGQSVPTAQATLLGSYSLSHVYGSLSSYSDVDLFLIRVDNFATFSASTVNLGTDSLLDTQLFLLSTSGKAVCQNDNAPGDPAFFHSTISGSVCSSGGTGPGMYLLGIASGYFNPVDANNDFLFASDGTDNKVFGAASSFALAGYYDNGAFQPNEGAYDIQLTGAQSVPEPASMLLVLGALGGCAWSSKRRQRTTPTSAI